LTRIKGSTKYYFKDKRYKNMRKSITEEAILFVSVLKWILLATAIGIIVGASVAFFLSVLNWSIELTGQFDYFYLLLPVVFFLVIVIIQYLAPDAKGHGTEKVIEAVHKNFGKIKPIVVPVKFITTIITIAFGGSAGKEGPCAQIGSGMASMFADILKFDNHDRKKLVICGISAGFASVFGTPIAGAIFGVEVLFAGSILYEVLLPSFVAGIVSFQLSSALGITYLKHQIQFVPKFSEGMFLEVIFAGIFFGLCSFLLIMMLRYGERLSDKIKIWEPIKGLIGGSILIILTLIFSKEYLGLGLSTIESSLNGRNIIFYAFFVKAIFTSITLSFGGSGGIVTPIFFVGATSGNIFAQMFGLDIATFSALGFVSLLAGAANTPIAASIMAIEYFGPAIGPYAVVACVISFLMTGHRSVYPSQILALSKSPSILVELGQEQHTITTQINLREKGLINYVLKSYQKIRILLEKTKNIHWE
jgi:H+/Cl- antiporter ClcA